MTATSAIVATLNTTRRALMRPSPVLPTDRLTLAQADGLWKGLPARAPEHERVPLTAPAAQRHGTVLDPAAAHLVDERRRHPRPRGAERVAEGDRAAVHVHDVLARAEHPRRVHGDGRE